MVLRQASFFNNKRYFGRTVILLVLVNFLICINAERVNLTQNEILSINQFYNIKQSDISPAVSLKRDIRAEESTRTTTEKVKVLSISCFYCDSKSETRMETSGSQNCYKGINLPSKKCAETESCFTEIHYTYIKRGCTLLGRLNRTFYCNCPLCNNKPSNESVFYDYKDLKDWEYHTYLLQTPLPSIELPCKSCETKGMVDKIDKNCKHGKNVDMKICQRYDLCYTNINDESDIVSRGCASFPSFNSYYRFCNSSFCNDENFLSTYPTKIISNRKSNRVKLKKNLANEILCSHVALKFLISLFLVNLLKAY